MTDVAADAELLDRVRRMWELGDPPPEHLADRVLFALELEDLDTEFELLRLTERSDALAGARGSTSDATHITFAGTELTMMLAVAAANGDTRRIDGWIAPATTARVVAHTVAGQRETSSDQTGRFVLEDVPAGMLRLVLHPEPTGDGTGDHATMPFVAPTVEI